MTAEASPARRGFLRDNLVWALVAFSYLWSFPFFPKLNNPNENVRLYMTRALVERHTLDISGVEAEWGWVNDKARNGQRVFSSKAPGVSLLGVPSWGRRPGCGIAWAGDRRRCWRPRCRCGCVR